MYDREYSFKKLLIVRKRYHIYAHTWCKSGDKSDTEPEEA